MQVAGYGAGSIGTAVFVTVPGLLLLYYLTDVLGVAAGLAAVILVVPKAWDVVLNPLVGSWSDRRAAGGGSRTPFLAAGAAVLPAAFVLLFAAPFEGALGGAWVAVMFFAAATAFAFFQVPYVALPAEMTASASGQTRLVAWRMGCLGVGILLAGAAGSGIAEGIGGRGGYLVMGAVLGVVLAVSLWTATRATRWVRGRGLGGEAATWPALPGVLRLGWFRALLLAFAAQALGVAVMLAGAPYVASYWLGDSGLTALLFLALVGPLVAVMPLWRRAAERFGPRRCLAVAAAGFGVVALLLLPAVRGELTALVFAGGGVLGCCYAGLQLASFSLLAHLIGEHGERTGSERGGAFTGVWTAAETAMAALGPGVFALVLALGSFRSSPADEPVPQPGSAETAILVGFTVVPSVLLLLSLVALARFAREHARLAPAVPSTTGDR